MYNGRAVDNTIHMTSSDIAHNNQHQPKTIWKGFIASHTNTIIQYFASNIVLMHALMLHISQHPMTEAEQVDTFLGSIPKSGMPIKLNCAVYVLFKNRLVHPSNGNIGWLQSTILECKQSQSHSTYPEELSHIQPPTPIHIDNSTTTIPSDDNNM